MKYPFSVFIFELLIIINSRTVPITNIFHNPLKKQGY